jgi:hypothetical protein
MKKAMLALLVVLSACTSNAPAEGNDEDSSGPTIYEQISLLAGKASVGQASSTGCGL